MELNNLVLDPLTKNLCRTCLEESNTICTNIQDLIDHDKNKIKLIDILVFLNCLENNDEENWPQGMCESCVSHALTAYSFKLNCLKANMTLTRLFPETVATRSDMDSIDINVVYQDHGYDLPLFNNHVSLDFEQTDNKELTPLPSVTELTSSEKLVRQENEKRFTCSYCDKSFTKIYGLRLHMAKHEQVDVKNKFLCPKCGKGFQTSSGLRQHLQSHKIVGQYKCGFCNKNYKSKQSLKEHFRVSHSNNRYSSVCTFCGKCFTARSTLLKHMKAHMSDKQYQCPDCPKSYTRASYLKVHQLVHSGVVRPKPFVCEYEDCKRKFPTKYSLTVHKAHVHNPERPFSCDVCSKHFPTNSGLKAHKESHVRRVLTCSICSKQVANKRMLQKHMKVHDDDTTDMILETVINNSFFDHIYY